MFRTVFGQEHLVPVFIFSLGDIKPCAIASLSLSLEDSPGVFDVGGADTSLPAMQAWGWAFWFRVLWLSTTHSLCDLASESTLVCCGREVQLPQAMVHFLMEAHPGLPLETDSVCFGSLRAN